MKLSEQEQARCVRFGDHLRAVNAEIAKLALACEELAEQLEARRPTVWQDWLQVVDRMESICGLCIPLARAAFTAARFALAAGRAAAAEQP